MRSRGGTPASAVRSRACSTCRCSSGRRASSWKPTGNDTSTTAAGTGFTTSSTRSTAGGPRRGVAPIIDCLDARRPPTRCGMLRAGGRRSRQVSISTSVSPRSSPPPAVCGGRAQVRLVGGEAAPAGHDLPVGAVHGRRRRRFDRQGAGARRQRDRPRPQGEPGGPTWHLPTVHVQRVGAVGREREVDELVGAAGRRRAHPLSRGVVEVEVEVRVRVRRGEVGRVEGDPQERRAADRDRQRGRGPGRIARGEGSGSGPGPRCPACGSRGTGAMGAGGVRARVAEAAPGSSPDPRSPHPGRPRARRAPGPRRRAGCAPRSRRSST